MPRVAGPKLKACPEVFDSVNAGFGGSGVGIIPCNPEAADPADVVIVSDAVQFCRLVANRAAPAELDLHITGDAERAAAVLAAAPVLALD